MSERRVREQTEQNQATASDPRHSVWVSANAGSGKTHVLVERILRLLLDGAEPRRILCLTYTKAAAAEMSNRVFARLSDWATETAAALRADLTALMRTEPTEPHLTAARRMFAATLDAPGQMRIHTIHAFCERLLQRFPLEAGLPPGFTVLDDTQAKTLRDQAFDATLANAASGRNSRLAEALEQILGRVNELSLRELTAWAVEQRTAFRDISEHHQTEADIAAAEHEALLELFGVPPDATEAALLSELAGILDDATLQRIVGALSLGSASDLKARDRFQRALDARSDTARIAALTEAFLTDGNPRKSICTKKIDSSISEMLAEACEHFHALALRLNALRIAEASAAMLVFVDAVRHRYGQAKARETALDFSDLIERTRSLLLTSDAAAWVLYKLDGGIDHILVDEAQDTSDAQWRIVEQLAEEFFAGEGREGGNRTLFAVGDEKQSIFSFQGAAPSRFAETGRMLRQKAKGANLSFETVPLTVSFRSTPAVLEAVDAVFAQPAAAAGLVSIGKPEPHYAFRRGHAGLVEVWPVEEVEVPDAAPAFRPLEDDKLEASASAKLADRIASRILRMIGSGEILASHGRPIEPRDILILVRRRGAFAPAMVDALKARDIPVAGADRMLLAEHLAAQDLVALGAFLLLPEDDLSLACVLKSPLIGLDDDDLFAIGYGRDGPLWSALRARREKDSRFAEAAAQLEAWLRRVDLVPPYEFYATLLGEHDQEMRRRMLAALGPGAADALDEFLELALQHDARAAPSMQGFLAEFASGAAIVKRDMEQGRNEVRVMTVHGAKGLEANIVFLPDTCGLPPTRQNQLLPTPRTDAPGAPPYLVHDFPGSDMVPEIRAARDARIEADMAEYRRLLYVGLTRARDRLYVCGWKGKNNYSGKSWQALVREALGETLQPANCPDAGNILRREDKQEVPRQSEGVDAAAPLRAEPPPDWARHAPPEERRPRAATPSSIDMSWDAARDLGLAEPPALGPAALAADARFLRGRIAHVLLQHLPERPQAAWETAAKRLAEARGKALGEEGRVAIVAETLAILRDPRFAPLFGPGSRAEVPFVARLANGVELAGQIDRLVDLGDEVLVVDYKTNRPPPKKPEGVAPAYLAQLAAYRVALRLALPGKPVRAALVWTDGPRLMPIPDALLDAAEQRILAGGANLDAKGTRP